MGIENPTPSLRRFQGITDLLLFQQIHCGPVEKAGFGAAISFDAGAITLRDRYLRSSVLGTSNQAPASDSGAQGNTMQPAIGHGCQRP